MKVPVVLKTLLALLLPVVVLYVGMFSFNTYTGAIVGRSENAHTSRMPESRAQAMEDTPHGSFNVEAGGRDLNLGDVMRIIRNLSEQIRDIRTKIKRLEGGSNETMLSETAGRNETGLPPKLLTLFSTWTKSEETNTIHRNTLKNWAAFRPVVNPVLFTNESELAEEAVANGWTVYPISKTADNGLPVLKNMFLDAMSASDSMFYCYANADILFDGGLVKTLVHIIYTLHNDLFLKPLFITGLRWNVINVNETEITPRSKIKMLKENRGKVFVTSAEDYFVTSRNYPWRDIPEVVVGSIAYDNWLVANAREKKHFVINSSRTIIALHQSRDENDYRSHVRDTVNYNVELLKEVYKINLPYHKGYLECIEKYTDFVNDTFVLGDRLVNQYCN